MTEKAVLYLKNFKLYEKMWNFKKKLNEKPTYCQGHFHLTMIESLFLDKICLTISTNQLCLEIQ